MKKILLCLMLWVPQASSYVKQICSTGAFEHERNNNQHMIAFFAPDCAGQPTVCSRLETLDDRYDQLSKRYSLNMFRFVQIEHPPTLEKLSRHYRLGQDPSFMIFQSGKPISSLYGSSGYDRLKSYVHRVAENAVDLNQQRAAGKKRIKTKDQPWYSGMPQNWAAPGQWFAGPMNRKYYGGNNAFPGPGRWIGAQW